MIGLNMNVYLPNLRLPSTYQEVEWIQGTGSQYINTGFALNQNSKAEFMVSNLITDSGNHNIFGADKGWRNSGFTVYYGQYGGQAGQVSFGSTGEGGGSNCYIADGNIHTGTLSKDGYYVDGTLCAGPRTYTFTSVNLYLFALNRNGSASEYSNTGRIHYIKLYDNGTLVRNFVPCYRKSDNVIGMYDLVNSVFYTNSGTGTFSKGNDVTMSVLKNAYIGEVWTPGSNTVAYYPLEKDGNDYSGNNHNLTWTGTPVYTISGGTKQVTSFNGNTLGMINSLSGSYTNYTFNVRAKPTSNSFGQIFWNANTTNNAWEKNVYLNWVLTSYEQASKYDFGYQYRAGSGSYTNLYGTTNRTLNTWYNFCVIGSSNGVTGYVNGTQIFTTSASSTINLVSGQNDIGGYYRIYQGDKGTYFNGYLSEFILEGKSWTAQEILNYYNQTKSQYGL